MHNVKRFFWIVCVLSCPIAAMAQDGGAFSNLFRRSPGGKATTVTVDTPSTAIPSPVEVRNGTRVTVTGRKSPVETCVVATKREELKPEPNPLGQFIKILAGIPVPAGAPESITDDCRKTVASPDNAALRIDSALDSLQSSIAFSDRLVKATQTDYEVIGNLVSKFIACKDQAGDICSDLGRFTQARNDLKGKVDKTLDKPLPVIESIELQLASVKKLLEERLKTISPTPTLTETDWLADVSKRLDCLGGHIAALRRVIESLKAAKAELEKFSDLIAAHIESFNEDDDPRTAPLFTYSKVLPEDNNAKVSGTVTCTNFFTKQVSVEAIPFTVTYQNLPRASVTMGVLFTTLNKRQVGTQAVRTGTAADGTPTFLNTFAVTDRSGSQVVPFSFFNVYLSGTRQMNLNLTGGIGVNPNNGKNQAEFFAGAALGFKNVYVQFGGHVGRWQELGGGFGFGETVPANFPGVPIERRYTMRPAVGLSYRLPLP